MERAPRSDLVHDLLASIVVFLVALPLCMGIAIASGMPPAVGLITGIIGGLVVGFLQGAPFQVSGPAAGLSVIVFDLVSRYGVAGVGVVVACAGLLQLTGGLLKLGRWFQAVPPAVIHGMLAGIGVLIFASQLHVMVDDQPKGSGLDNLLSIPGALYKGLIPNDTPHHAAAMVGVGTILVLLAWQHLTPRRLRVVPAALVAVAAATLWTAWRGVDIALVTIPDSLTSVVRPPSGESLRRLLSPAGLQDVLVLAAVASAETMLCAAAVDRMHTGPRTNYDRELAAQGVGNLVCGVLGVLPMTGVIVRSSTNVDAGARSRRSAILHGAWLLVFVVALPWVLARIPVASLAAVLVYTGYKLFNPARIAELSRRGWGELAIFIVTVVTIVATDLLKGVLVGLALATGRLLITFSRLDVELDSDPARKRSVLRLAGPATFLRLPELAEALDRVPGDHELHVRFERLDHVDHAALDHLMAWEEQWRARGGRVVIDWDELDRKLHAGRRRLTPAPSGHSG